MQRRILAALAAFALATQVVGALAAFAQADEEESCACPMRGKDHHCNCPDCAQHRSNQEGHCSIGCCSSGSAMLGLASPERPFLPALAISETLLPPSETPRGLTPVPQLAPARDVPTPPPLAA